MVKQASKPTGEQGHRSGRGLRWLGMAAVYAWLGWFLTLPEVGGSLPFPAASVYPSFVVACAVVLVVGARLGKAVHACGTFDILASICLLVASVLRALGLLGEAGVVASAVLGGAGAAYLYCRWLDVFRRFELRESIARICAAVAVAALVKLACAFVSGPVLAVVGCVLALAGLPCLFAYGQDGTAAELDPATTGAAGKLSLDGHMREELVGTVACLMALSFVLGVAYNLQGAGVPADGASRLAGFVPELFAAGLLWAWVCRKGRSLSVPGIFCVLVIVIATGLVLLALPGAGAGLPMFTLLNVDHSLLTMFMWILLVDVAQRTKAPAMAVAAVGWGARSLAFALGGALADGLSLAFDPSAALVLVYISLGVLVAAVVTSRVGMERMLSRLVPGTTPAGEEPAGVGVVDSACDLATQRYGLTPREAEVLALLCQGRSRPYIAETLYLSENTVRNHAKHIYEKMGVHDRQSLLSLVKDLVSS